MAIKTDLADYVENPKVLSLPPAGGKYIDDLSGIEVLRFTDEHDALGRSFKNTYSVWPTLNCNNTRAWLFEYGGSYYVGNLNPTTFERVGPLEEFVPARGSFVDYETAFWSFIDPDKLFVLVDCQLWAYKPSAKTYQVVADLTRFFPAGARFNQLYVSQDDNRFAAMVKAGSSGSGDYGVMVYELSSNSIKLNVPMDNINGPTMDKSGKFVLINRYTDDPRKQYLYNVDTGGVEYLIADPSTGLPDFTIGHNDCGTDFIVGGDQWRGAFTARKMSSPHNVLMAWQYGPIGWINWHVSMRADNEAWATVSTYGGSLNADGWRQEAPFVREVFQVGVKEPFMGQLRRLVHTRANWEHPNYWDTPRATISRDGRFICWTSNNNGASGTSRTDLFIAKIEPAPSPQPTPVPVPIPTPDPNTPAIGALKKGVSWPTTEGKQDIEAKKWRAEGWYWFKNESGAKATLIYTGVKLST